VRQLGHDRLQWLAADDVTVGDAERLAALEAAQGPHHGVGVGEHGDFRAERGDEGLPLLGPPLADPHPLPGLGIGDHDLGEVRARGEDPQQRLERPRIPLEERGGRERAADRGHEPLERHEHAVRVALPGQQFGQPVAQGRDEIEGQAPLGERHERAAGAGRRGEARRAAPHRGGRLVVEEPCGVGGGRHGTGFPAGAMS
jgi:hypothetical protein